MSSGMYQLMSFSTGLPRPVKSKSRLADSSKYQRLNPVILATWEAKIGRTELQGQPRQIFHESRSPK
jgi:hypothetical protein